MALKQELVTLPHLDLTKDIVYIVAPDNTLAGATSPFGSLGPDQQQEVRARTAGTNPTIIQLSCHALERLHLEQLLPGDAAPAPAASSQPPQQQPQLAHPA